MKPLHLIFGLLVLVVFLLTGQYMHRSYNHLVGMSDGPRLLYRTRHIFILLAGLLNLGIGIYFSYRRELWRKLLQLSGSILIMLAPVLFIAGFFYEPKLDNLRTPFSHWGAYIIVAGMFFHLMSGVGEKSVAAS